MTIETNITNRRELASALAQYINTRAVYLGPPTFAYQIGDIHLSREGILSGNDLDGIFPFLEMQGIVTAQPKMIQEPAGSTASGIQIPLEGYTPVNLRNLFSMLYSKQWLIRKSCSMPVLRIPESAVNSMPTDTLESVVQSLLDLKAAGALTGIDITCEQIALFMEADADLEAVQIFLQHVVQSAKAATRVFLAYHPQENEKYIMHGWLIRLGLTGPEHKALRKSLMCNLRGNCAFRSATDAQTHRAKYVRLRRELREAGEMNEAMELMTSMMMSLLVGIASIALVVGGIGIMNMMLVTVTERTTEIGLRKALGAELGQIQMQFLIEAIILSLLGGLIGVVVGLAVSFAICMNTDITFALNTFAIGLGVSFSAAVGIIFGWAPARKASNLNPIDALRSM